MDPASLGPAVLVGIGLMVVVVGAMRARGPVAAMRRLDETQANLERYDSWRGKRTALEPDGPTGADVMRAQMRRRLMVWAAVGAVGLALVLVGLLLL